MMKPLTKKSIGAVAMFLAAAAGAVIALVVWIAASAHGTRWFLESVLPLSGAGFSAQKIEGCIGSHLLLKGIRVSMAQQQVELGTFELRWKPLMLLAGTAAIEELAIDGVRIHDSSPPDNRPPALNWPRVPGNAQLLDASIARLRVTDVSYRKPGRDPVPVTSFTGAVSWRNSLLTISDLRASSPSGAITGAVSADFDQPSLTAELAIALTQPLAEMNHFSLRICRGSSRAGEQLAGVITIAGSSGGRKLLELDGEAGMERNAINLRRLRLTSPVRRGMVTAGGVLALTPREPVLTLRVKAAGLDLAPELNVATDLSGVLTFAGTPDSYRGDFTFANQAREWRSATLSAVYHGTREGVKLAPLSAGIMGGTVSGNLDIDWRNGLTVQGLINGRNLDPARLSPDWEGAVNFSADCTLVRSGKGALSGSVRVSLLESRLHGQALSGDLQAAYAGSNLSINSLALHGRGFDLEASGDLDQRLTLAARISDFSRLVPGSAGAFKSEGWARWRNGHLSGAVSGTGNDLAYAGYGIGTGTMTARLDQGAGYPLHVAATLRDVTHDRYRLNMMTVAADGTLKRHTVNATLRADGSEADMTMSAGYDSGLWGGEITRFTGNDGAGRWNLAAPAAFAFSSEKIFLAPLAVTAGAAERIELAADLALNPLTGAVRAQWTGLNLARANTYLKEGNISGSSHGAVQAGFGSGRRLTLTGNAGGNWTFTGQGQSITIDHALVTLDGGEQGVRVGMEISGASAGGLKASFHSTAPLRLAMPAPDELRWEVTGEMSGIDLALFKAWLPRDTGVEGRITGRAKGAMNPGQNFVLDGNAVLSGGTIRRKAGKGELDLTFTSAAAAWGWRGESLSATISLATAGYGQARADFQLPVPARFPITLKSKEPLRATLSAELRENGAVSALFPEIVLKSSGELDAELAARGSWEAPLISGKLRLGNSGVHLSVAGININDIRITANIDNNLVRGDIALGTADYGSLKGTFASSVPLRLPLPAQEELQGELTAEVNGVDLALFKPWLPPGIGIEGHVSGRVKGTMFPGLRFELDGSAVLSGGAARQDREEGRLNVTFPSANVSWGWRGETLAGSLFLDTAGFGQARGHFRLPVPARFPVAVSPGGSLRASFTGQFQENGIISALFPDFVQKSSGELDADLTVGGSWEAPTMGGSLKLVKGAAYLPTAGIHVKDVRLAAHLDNNLVRIDSFGALSGPGHIGGTALLTLSGWRLAGYRGTISGRNFQTINFPELQILATPELRFEGTLQKLNLRGELRLPELHVVGAQNRTVIAPSSDVILEGRVTPLAGSHPLVLDVQLGVLLGEKVFVEVAGIDAQLGGSMELTFSSLDRITSTGEIKVIKGRYRTYGVKLDIARGRIFFPGGPIDHPTIDFLAQRTVGDVKAGVTVAGTLQKPDIRLYSEPAMPDVDILAYIVLGHPLGSNNEQAGRVNQAAGVLLSSSQASVLQEQIQSQLGLSTLAIEGGVGGTASHMGYKPLQVTRPGSVPAAQQPGITETMLTVGKYVTPELYISYGRSLFTQSNLFLLRYDIFKKWQIETQTGNESGADLFYKLEFK